MHRFFVDQIEKGCAVITGEDFHHLARVLRLHAGDEVTLSDGRKRDYDGVIERVDKDCAIVRVGAAYASPSEPGVEATLYQGLPKGAKLELIVQKCVELGAFSIVPVTTKRCVAEPARDFEKKRVRYQRIADEAAKQSRRGLLPAIQTCVPLESCDFSGYDLALVAYEDEKDTTLKTVLRENGAFRSLAIIVGPEGGFAPEEIEALKKMGVKAVSLGKSILRTETAGLAMLANVLYEACQ